MSILKFRKVSDSIELNFQKYSYFSNDHIYSELKTLEWINFNPDFLIRISTVETFHFSP